MNYQTMKFPQIVDWCKENKQTEWLKSQLFDKEGNKINISFMTLKQNFAEKFMPEIIPQAKPKKPTMWDIAKAL